MPKGLIFIFCTTHKHHPLNLLYRVVLKECSHVIHRYIFQYTIHDATSLFLYRLRYAKDCYDILFRKFPIPYGESFCKKFGYKYYPINCIHAGDIFFATKFVEYSGYNCIVTLSNTMDFKNGMIKNIPRNSDFLTNIHVPGATYIMLKFNGRCVRFHGDTLPIKYISLVSSSAAFTEICIESDGLVLFYDCIFLCDTIYNFFRNFNIPFFSPFSVESYESYDNDSYLCGICGIKGVYCPMYKKDYEYAISKEYKKQFGGK